MENNYPPYTITDKMLNYATDIIEQTQLSDSTVRRILRKFLQDEKIETTDDNEKSPNKKYKMTE